MALGENLRRLRKEKGWTQHELAERAGIKLTHISTLEKVESDPKLSTIIKLIGALECSPNDLLATDGPKGLAAGLRVAIEKAMRLPSQDKTLLLHLIDKFLVSDQLRKVYELNTPLEVLEAEAEEERIEQILLDQEQAEDEENERYAKMAEEAEERASVSK
jgi:transcriptional regulator with XRE-family HTH domain